MSEPTTAPRSLFDLTGRRALITGSSGGIGLELARGLAQHGAAVVLNGRTAARVTGAVDALRAEGLDATPAVFDVTDEAQVGAGIARVLADGDLHVLINNAGIQRRGALVDLPLATWDEVLRTDLTAPMLVSRAVAPHFLGRGSGKIVHVLSVMSEVGRRSVAPYTAAKGGLKMLTRAMCAEWAPGGVQVNGLGPGYFRTDMNAALLADPAFTAWVEGRTPAGRWGDPRELVGAAVFLSAPASDFVNGQVLYVDGGMLAVL
ncbi:gluconate 5-dehydrogenase [Deinococcus metalli]|uniref:Gluconate 5-dehydrogenase n=1 Tax=Deinococcus metalli TaxID=1141878 RepID=A0A7W8NMD1_9DEIO|nr:SDR family oxidoreductase [Deinococcus metalli]MBB5375679.1 gluconate 5-dehydrogenase [Deinococcus metalli]GHF37839.1 gluconate 5-dehydrogenase [Deinococcus metalli]